MRNIIFALCLFIFPILASSQELKENITVDFKGVSLKTALENIETVSGYKFYFLSEWLDAQQDFVTGSFENKPVSDILDTILQKTELNFFIQGNKVILTRNSVIYDKLPDNFFAPSARQNQPDTDKPVLYRQENLNQEPNTVALIGKEKQQTDKKLYTLTGYLKNIKTGEPVSNVAIRVQKKNISAVTDGQGFYKLQLPGGPNVLETDSFTYKKLVKKVIMYNDGLLDLKVDENINSLDEVVVNAQKKENLKSAITGVTTIDIEGMKNIPLVLGERDIFKVAASLPGIKTAGEGSAGYNVRGGKEDQNLVLLDNALLYNPAHFFGFFSAVNPFTTKEANIYKGSIPAEFGGRLSSVFDITTKTANTEKFAGEGGIGPITSNLSLGIPVVKGKSSLTVGGRATYSDWILRSLKSDELKNSQASFYDAIVKYSHTFNANNSIESTFYYSRDAFSITSDSLYKYSNRLASLKYDHSFNDKNKGSLILTNSEYKFNIDYQSGNENAFDFGYKLNETQAMLKMKYLMSNKHKFGYGISSKLYDVSPGYLNPKEDGSLLVAKTIQKERGLESAAYISDNFKVSNKLLVDIGLRYSYFAALGKSTQRIYEAGLPLSGATVAETKTFANNEVIKGYGGFEPRVAARYFLGKDFSIKASYDKTYQYIHLLSNNTTQSPTDTWKLSDLNVAPQMAQQFSLGLYKNLQSDMYELSLEGYYKKSNNFLDYKVGAELLLNENIETELLQGKGKAYGVELLLKKTEGRLNGWIGYTYSRTFVKLDSKFENEKVNNGRYFAANFDKPHDISVVMNYKFTKRYSLSGNFVYQTGRPITYPIGSYTYNGAQYTLYSDRNAFRIPDYYRLDIGVNIEGNHKIKKLAHGFWNVSIYNVLGRNNPYSVYFVTDSGKIKAYKTSIFSVPVPTVTYNFKF
jgi:hypothetical protein